MLPHWYRLPLHPQQRFQGKRIRGRFFDIIVADNTITVPRFGIVVSAKTIKQANKRNRLKRQWRAIVSQHLNTTHKDWLFIAKTGVYQLDFQMLKHEINTLLSS